MEISNLIKRINSIVDDSDRKDFIKSISEDDLGYYDGTNVDGETILVFICSNGYRVSTYQSNGWIRINEYTLDVDGDIVISEYYEKGDE